MDLSNNVCHLCIPAGASAPITLVIPLSNQFTVTCISVLSPAKCIKRLHYYSICARVALQILDHRQQKFSILCRVQTKS